MIFTRHILAASLYCTRAAARCALLCASSALAAFFLLAASPCGAVTAGSVDDLVKNPPLPDVHAKVDWDYESQFLLSAVYNALRNEHYSLAEESAVQLAETFPADPQILRLAVHLTMRGKKWNESEIYLTRLLDLEPGDLAMLTRRGYVRLQLQQGDFAAADFDRVLASSPSPQLRAYVADALRRIKEEPPAAKQAGQEAWAALESALAPLEGEGKWEEAESALDAYINERPGDMRAFLARGRARMEQNRFESARSDLRLVRNSPLGEAFQEQASRALLALDRKILDPEWKESGALEASGDFPALEQKLTRMLAAAPGNTEILYHRALARFRLGGEQLAAARSDLAEALAAPYLPGDARKEAEALALRVEAQIREEEQARRQREAEAEKARLAETEAERLRQARNLAWERSAARVAAGEEPDWDDVQRAENRLKAEEKWDELEWLYTDLIARYPSYAYAYLARGHARLSRGTLEGAHSDFTRARELETDPETISAIGVTMADVEQRLQTREREQAFERKEQTLARREDWRGLERLYGEAVRNNPGDPRMRYKRGVNHMEMGRLPEAKADFQAALGLRPVPALRKNILAELGRIRGYESSGTPYRGGRADALLYRANKQVMEEHYAQAEESLAGLEACVLSAPQEGLRDYVRGRMLWNQGARDKAYPLFRQAAALLPEDFFLAEACARMAEYELDKGYPETARASIDRSLAAAPGSAWRLIQAGDIYSRLEKDEEALAFYDKALADGGVPEENIHFFSTMAEYSRRMGDEEKFHLYARRNIDAAEKRLARKENPTEEDRRAVHDLKKTYSQMTQSPIGGSLYALANFYKDNDRLSLFTGELKYRETVYGYRTEYYVKLGGTFDSSYSGTYFDSWAGSSQSWNSDSSLDTSMYTAFGARAYPFAGYGFNLGAEQVLKLGEDEVNDTRFIAETFEAIGDDWEPVKDNWAYASFWGNLTYSTYHNDLTAAGNARLGRGFAVPHVPGRLVTVTPFVSASYSYRDRDTPASERWGLDAGPGVSVRKWFKEDDPYKVPLSSVDCVIQYSFGISHNRGDYLSLSLYYSF